MCCVVEADCSDLISLFWGLLDQLWICFERNDVFFKAGVGALGEGIGAQQRETTTFFVLDFKVYSNTWAVPTGAELQANLGRGFLTRAAFSACENKKNKQRDAFF